MLSRRALLATPALLTAATARAGTEPGTHVLTLDEPRGIAPGPMRVFMHRPARWSPDGPLLLVMHGVQRDAERYLAEWRDLAEAANVLVICPEFSSTKFPGARWYKLGKLFDRERAGAAQPRTHWTFPVADTVVAAVRARTGWTRRRFDMFGHSAGAQFVHRYALFSPSNAVDRIIVANAGWYTMPDTRVPFPYGLGGSGVTEAEIAIALARPVTVLLGDQDVDPQHPSLRRNAEADRQGLHRFARGHAFFESARAETARLAVPFAWRLEIVPGVAHQNAGMARAAVRLLTV
jgi:poly(3-hydroxybutyrate) depolymerase